jgi:hypothetical protein
VDLTSVGTFFAFILVCGGVLYLDINGMSEQAKFKMPFINGKFIVGAALLGGLYFAQQHGGIATAISEKPLMLVFWAVWTLLAVGAFLKNLSLIPILGILTNLYLMTELGWSNWRMFLSWLAIGLVIYFSYGFWHSKLRTANG